jgi:hypothetical protein
MSVKKTLIKTKVKTQKEILIENAEEVIAMIGAAKNYDDIQERFLVRRENISWFIAESDYSARAREAQKESAEEIATKAEKAILEIESADTSAKVTRQRELAHHYRWLASKKNPYKFGDGTILRGDNDAPLNPSVNLILNK